LKLRLALGCRTLLTLLRDDAQPPNTWEARMLDAFIWYTGIVFWISVLIGLAGFAAAEAHDRNVRRRRFGPR